ncbi:hypothetical protein EI555_002327, partial [Monodon monoceros]
MILSQLTTLLSLLSGAWLPTGSGRPGPRGLPAQPQAAANETQSLGQGAPAFPVPSSALGSWKAFLGLQKTGQLGTGRMQHGQDVAITVSATGPTGSGPGDVLSRLGCMAVYLLNHLCFGHCSSFYIPVHPLQQLCACSHALGTCGPLSLPARVGPGGSGTARPGRRCEQCPIHAASQRHGNAPAPPAPRAGRSCQEDAMVTSGACPPRALVKGPGQQGALGGTLCL